MSAPEDSTKERDTPTSKMADPESKEASRDSPPPAPDAAPKRKASSPTIADDETPNSPKRAKTENRDKADDHRPSRPPTVDRREMARQEEKKRGRRLLGGLMNTLSQAGAGAGSQNRKRQEVERRQQAKTAQQRDDENRRRADNLAKLASVRKVEQLKFEEDVMRTKHRDILAKARFLKTRARPQVYYRPWELTRLQEDQIKDQIEDAERLIEKEVSAFKERKERRLRALGVVDKPAPTERQDPVVGKPSDEQQPTDKPHSVSTSDHPIPQTTPAATTAAEAVVSKEKDSADRADDVMIEEDEDTVIY